MGVNVKIKSFAFAFALLLLAPVIAHAQSIGGNTSVTASTGSSRAALPAALADYPAVLMQPVIGTDAEVFYKFGDATVVATTSGPTLPSGGVCLIVGGSATKDVAMITSTGSVTVRITQLKQCPMFSSSKGGTTPPPPTCTNVLDLTVACNSQYVAAF